MFERYTEKARRAIFFARYEASQFGSPYIETEHLLLGLLRDDKALASNISIVAIRKKIEEHTPIREKFLTSVDLSLSYESKRVLAYAAQESDQFSHKHIGTEHLLMGIQREDNCFAKKLLQEFGITKRENMKITLRKASALQLIVKEKINEDCLTPTVSIGRFEDPAVAFDKAFNDFNKIFAQKTVLTEALYEIRKKVSAVSQQVGVSDALADIARIDKYLEMYKPLVTIAKFAPSDDVLATQHADLQSEVRPEDRYAHRRESIEVSIIYSDSIDTWKDAVAALKREKQALSDTLLELNVKNEIELSDATVDTLKTYGIL